MAFRKRSAPMTGDLEKDLRRVECPGCGRWHDPVCPASMQPIEKVQRTSAEHGRDMAVRGVLRHWNRSATSGHLSLLYSALDVLEQAQKELDDERSRDAKDS